MEFNVQNPTKRSKAFCSVFGCNSKASRSPQLAFHYFPTLNRNFVFVVNKLGQKEKIDVLAAWKRVLKMGKPITKNMLVCSLHFQEKDYFPRADTAKKKKLKRTAVPSVNLPKVSHSPEKRSRKEPANRKVAVQSDEHDLPFSTSASHESHRTEEELEAANTLCLMAFQTMYKDFGVQVNTGQIKTICDNIETDKQLNTLTGLRSFKLLDTIENIVSKFYTAKRTRRLLLRERIILTFVKLKHNTSYVVLSFLFGNLSSETCKSVFFEMLTVLSQTLQYAVPFLDRNVVRSHMPKCFKDFPTVRIILDCTEIAVQKSSCLCCQIKTYSHYKSTYTLKFMTGVSPSGLITFVSRMYGGRVSDKMIFEQSGLIAKMEKGDSIMVDKGFLIDEICEKYDIVLVRPPFLKKQPQLSFEEAQKNAKIARPRVHIERSNQRLKVFSILNKVQWNLVPKMEEVLTIICAIVNLSKPILSKERF